MKKLLSYSQYIKIFLVLLGCLCILLIVIPLLFSIFTTNNHSEKQSETYEINFVDTPKTIEVYRINSGKTERLPFEEYIKCVVSCEMPSSFHLEALKAQSVAARTYSTSKIMVSKASGNPSTHPDAPLCDSTHCQVYKSEKELKNDKGNAWMKNDYKKIEKAVNETEGELLYYEGELIKQALFHSSSGGKTENSEDVFASAVPYLVSVESPYENDATHQNETTALSINEFKEEIMDYDSSLSLGRVTKDNIKILKRSSGNRVEKIQVGNVYLSGRQIREALNLPSANFTIKLSKDNIIITSNGSGHGVGMSQYGANGMAKEGYGYKKILSHYYRGTEIY